MKTKKDISDCVSRRWPKTWIILACITLILAIMLGIFALILLNGPLGAVVKTQRETAALTRSSARSPAMEYVKINDDLVFVVAGYHSSIMGRLAVPYFVLRTETGWETIDLNYNTAALLEDPANIRSYAHSSTFVEQFGDYTVIWFGFYLSGKHIDASEIKDSLGSKPILVSAETIGKPKTGWGGWGNLLDVNGLAWSSSMNLSEYSAFLVVKDMPENYSVSVRDLCLSYDDIMSQMAKKS